jgi:acetolactate decarboxylase
MKAIIGYTAIFTLLILMNSGCTSSVKETKNQVQLVGQMKDVMRKGQLQGNINLDTITDKKHLFGLGPVAYLTGEILILDGKSYKSTVLTDTTMRVEETFAIEAPFFGYANIPQWSTQALPDSIANQSQLERYLNQITQNAPRPFFFQLTGTVDEAAIHIVNLPEGTKVSSPEEAHQGLVDYHLTQQDVTIVGFFSTEHQAIFTHHDTFIHMHLITKDQQMMGHIDEVHFKKGTMTLHLPKE